MWEALNISIQNESGLARGDDYQFIPLYFRTPDESESGSLAVRLHNHVQLSTVKYVLMACAEEEITLWLAKRSSQVSANPVSVNVSSSNQSLLLWLENGPATHVCFTPRSASASLCVMMEGVVLVPSALTSMAMKASARPLIGRATVRPAQFSVS